VAEPPLLYLDQNYLSGIVKRKPAFRELEPVLRDAVARGAVAVAESAAHGRESAARPDLSLLELLRELSGGRRLPHEPGAAERNVERRLRRFAAAHFPERVARASDEVDFGALAIALPRCELIACDAFMADVVRRAGLDRRFGSAVFGGRRRDVLALRDRLALTAE
jgi:predicted nucleic acid-binding protein